MTTTQQSTEDPKARHLACCMERLERKLFKTRFSEAEKQIIRDREIASWHLWNDDVPICYYR